MLKPCQTMLTNMVNEVVTSQKELKEFLKSVTDTEPLLNPELVYIPIEELRVLANDNYLMINGVLEILKECTQTKRTIKLINNIPHKSDIDSLEKIKLEYQNVLQRLQYCNRCRAPFHIVLDIDGNHVKLHDVYPTKYGMNEAKDASWFATFSYRLINLVNNRYKVTASLSYNPKTINGHAVYYVKFIPVGNRNVYELTERKRVNLERDIRQLANDVLIEKGRANEIKGGD